MKTLSDEEFMYLLETEAVWRNSRQRISERDLLSDIPDAASMLLSQISEWSRKKLQFEKAIEAHVAFAIARIADEFERWFALEIIKISPEGQDYERCAQHIRRLKILLRGLVPGRDRSILNVDGARLVPIVEVISRDLVIKRSGSRYVALCPFHPEKSPSFTIYPATNSYYCHGCGKGGDGIQFLRDLHNLSFTDAVKALEVML